MYEVFLNDRKIQIRAEGKITLKKPTLNFSHEADINQVCKWFNEFRINDSMEVTLTHQEPRLFFENIFKSSFTTISAAGGIVLRKSTVLFIFRNNTWDLPKGKIEKGETSIMAAIREVEEECGIKNPVPVKPLPTTYHLFLSPFADTNGQWILKETFWYEMKYDKKSDGSPQQEENIDRLKWFKRSELPLAMENTYANLKPIIQLYLD